jgi:hypothetical protein
MCRLVVACLFVFLHAEICSLAAAADSGSGSINLEQQKEQLIKVIQQKANAKEQFDAPAIARKLEQALHQTDADEETIMDALTLRSSSQIQEVRKAYSTSFGADLCDAIKSLVPDIQTRELFVGLCYSPAEFDAYELHKAIDGEGTTEATLIEILVTRTNRQIIAIKEAYFRLYHSELERDIAGDTSGDLKSLLLALAKPSRDETDKTDRAQADKDANILYDAGENYNPLGSWFPFGTWGMGTDEQTFIDKFTTINCAQMELVEESYLRLHGNRLEDAVKSEFAGSYIGLGFSGLSWEGIALVAILRKCDSPSGYFADLLGSAFPQGWEKLVNDFSDATNWLINDQSPAVQDVLRRIFLSRREIDLTQIERAFDAAHSHSLMDLVTTQYSGIVRQTLVRILYTATTIPLTDRVIGGKVRI